MATISILFVLSCIGLITCLAKYLDPEKYPPHKAGPTLSWASVAMSGLLSDFNFNRFIQLPCPHTTQRYKNLFVSRASIQKMTTSRQFQETFRVGKVRQQFPFPGICNSSNTNSLKALSLCDWSQKNNRERIGVNACCETKLSITIPHTVNSIFTGEPVEVVHMPSSYQLLHEAKCARPKTQCSTGRCELAYRLQWILVKQGTQESFVPVSVGNHCYCSFL